MAGSGADQMTSPRTVLPPRTRAALIAWAKRKAVPVASCVNAGVCPDHLLEGASGHELAALVIVLAAAADPVRLREVLAAGDDGTPAEVAEEALRWAHAEVRRLRDGGQPIPGPLARLEHRYQEQSRAAREDRRAA
jgi:hypothetical protein